MKRLLEALWPSLYVVTAIFCMSMIANSVHAAPFVVAAPVPSDWRGPSQVLQSTDDGATWSAAPCAWKTSGATKTPACDLAGTDTSPGTRKLRYKYVYVAACDPGGAGPCIAGGEADVPFGLTWLPTLAPTGVAVVPSAP